MLSLLLRLKYLKMIGIELLSKLQVSYPLPELKEGQIYFCRLPSRFGIVYINAVNNYIANNYIIKFFDGSLMWGITKKEILDCNKFYYLPTVSELIDAIGDFKYSKSKLTHTVTLPVKTGSGVFEADSLHEALAKAYLFIYDR
jgi:hypothetical protein